MKFPRVRGRSSDGERVYLPVDFEGDPTLVLITFQWQQRSLVNAWREFADGLVEEYDNFEYAELFVSGGGSGLHPPMMSGGLAPPTSGPPGSGGSSGAPGSSRPDDRTIVLHVDKRAFRRSLGLLGEQTIYALLVDDEYVVRQAAGMLTRDIAEGLESLLAEWDDAQQRWTEARAAAGAEAESADE